MNVLGRSFRGRVTRAITAVVLARGLLAMHGLAGPAAAVPAATTRTQFQFGQ